MWWKRPRLWFFVLLTAALSLSAALVWFLTREGRERADQWSSSIFGAVSAAAVVVSVLVWLWRRGGAVAAEPTADLVDAAVVALVRAQMEQWTAEETARRVQDPWPLPVRWQVSARARAVMASWASVRGKPGAGPIRLDGRYDHVTAVFTASGSPRRLVVLGEPGAGKSMLVLRLTLELLELLQAELRAGGTPTGPVPVLLSIAAWDPAQPLDDWIADRLAADNRSLARRVGAPNGTRRSLAQELVAGGRVMPILDGLDEMAAGRRGAALAGIAAAVSAGRQFVLTSRTTEYEVAVRADGSLARTPVIEIQPLRPADVVRYLVDGTDEPGPRWDRVTAHLTGATDRPLAQALSTPLMAWLARVVYHHRGTDPGQLLTASWATSRQEIEEHLLDQLIPAVYGAAIGGYPAYTPVEINRARRWLANLAGHLQSRGTHSLAWWELVLVLPRALLAVSFGLAGVLVGGLAFGLIGYRVGALPLGIACGTVLGLTVGVTLGLTGPGVPKQLALSGLRGARVPFAVVGGCWLALQVGFTLDDSVLGVVGLPVVAGILGGLCLALVPGLITRAHDEQKAISPAVLLIEDRKATLGFWLAVGFVLGIPLGSPVGVVAVFVAAFVVVPVLGLTFGIGSAWTRFWMARALLAARGQLPLRLMAFLREAHDRGVLRQAGGVYQFRHNRLQEHLANTTT